MRMDESHPNGAHRFSSLLFEDVFKVNRLIQTITKLGRCVSIVAWLFVAYHLLSCLDMLRTLFVW